MAALTLRICVTAAVLAFVSPGLAYAQAGSADPEFEGGAGAVVVNGLAVRRRQDLWFGTIAPNLTASGTVRVNRGRNNDSTCDTVLVCLRPGNRARFTVIGEPDLIVLIDGPDSITLQGPGGATMLVDSFTGAGSGNNTEWRGWQRLRPAGFNRFNVGATLHVNPNQPPGEYVGVFTITVSYQ